MGYLDLAKQIIAGTALPPASSTGDWEARNHSAGNERNEISLAAHDDGRPDGPEPERKHEISTKKGTAGSGEQQGGEPEGPEPGLVFEKSTKKDPAVFMLTEVEQVEAAVEALSTCPVLGIDTETYGPGVDDALDPHRGSVRLLTLAGRDQDSDTDVAYVIDCTLTSGWQALVAPLLTDPAITKAGHNLKFDLGFLLAAGLSEFSGLFDTMLAAQVLDGGQHLREPGRFTLATVTEQYQGQTVDKGHQTSDWGAEELTDAQLRYAALDAAILLPLHDRLVDELAAARLTEAASVEMRALPAVAWMEHSGAPFDVEAWLELSDGALRRKLELQADIEELLVRTLGGNDLFGFRINLDSPAQVVRVLNDLGLPVDDTNEDTLVQHKAHPVVEKLLAFREASKNASVYGVQFVAKHVHPVTGRIHADFHQVGAATGRMSCTNPNLQNIPHSKEYRSCFRPPEGRVLVKADLSLIELCVAAELSGDEKMTAAIAAKQDLHRLTAAALFQVSPEDVTPAQRAFGKTVNFGTLYGQGRGGLIRQAAQQGLELSHAEATTFQRRFAAAWPALSSWQRRQMDGRGTEVRTASGRVRYLGPDAPGTVRANTPVQGTASDGFKQALGLLWDTRSRCPSASLVAVVHDEVVVECDAEDAEAVAGWVEQCLRDGMGVYLQRVPVSVTITVAPSWGG